MKAEIITIGDEILIGQVVDTNSAFIAEQLNEVGISVTQMSSIPDEKAHIIKAFQEAEYRADLIIVTGGLGPTKDDVTKNTFCEYFDDTLIQNQEVLTHITQLFYKISQQPLNDLNIQQALVPSKALVLKNEHGTAPGIWMVKGGKVFIALPGVPYEMKALIQNYVIPKLTSEFKMPFIVHRTIVTHGEPESVLAERIAFWEDALPKHIKLAYLPSLGMIRLRLSGTGKVKKDIESEVQDQIDVILPHLKAIFLGYDNVSLELEVGRLLTEKKQTLSLAESCTGGLIAASITSNAGASSFFKGGLVTYFTSTKVEVLKVLEQTIKDNSVVSREVALEMAKNARQLFNSDFAISVTGNAGPEKGDSLAEVGTVFIGIATQNKTIVEVFDFGTNRYRVQQKTKNKALELLRSCILGK